MSEEFSADLRAGAAEAAAALRETASEGEAAARVISEAFRQAGGEIGASLEAAARAGELGFSRMAEAILQDLARLAVNEIAGGAFEGFARRAGQFFEGVTGQRAEGGPVLGGERYLVGERGPEVFTPMSAGAVQPLAPAAPVNVTIVAGGSAADSVRRSERQIAAAVARAVQAGRASL